MLRKTTVVEPPRKITPVDPGFQCPRKGGAERPKLKGVNAQIYRSPFSNFGSFVLLLLAPISVVLGASPFTLVAHFGVLGASSCRTLVAFGCVWASLVFLWFVLLARCPVFCSSGSLPRAGPLNQVGPIISFICALTPQHAISDLDRDAAVERPRC